MIWTSSPRVEFWIKFSCCYCTILWFQVSTQRRGSKEPWLKSCTGACTGCLTDEVRYFDSAFFNWKSRIHICGYLQLVSWKNVNPSLNDSMLKKGCQNQVFSACVKCVVFFQCFGYFLKIARLCRAEVFKPRAQTYGVSMKR